MSGTRLIPTGAGFPYEAVKSALLALPKVETSPVELERMIETGKRLGWSK